LYPLSLTFPRFRLFLMNRFRLMSPMCPRFRLYLLNLMYPHFRLYL
jgi:hypothetical protein